MKRRRVYPPVQVEWRWLRRPGEVDPWSGCVELNGAIYGVVVYPRQRRAEVIKPLLDGQGGCTVYDVDLSGTAWTCDCPDFVFRDRRCKHIGFFEEAVRDFAYERWLDGVEAASDRALLSQGKPAACTCEDATCLRCQVDRAETRQGGK
jgi:hypothetical protein